MFPTEAEVRVKPIIYETAHMRSPSKTSSGAEGSRVQLCPGCPSLCTKEKLICWLQSAQWHHCEASLSLIALPDRPLLLSLLALCLLAFFIFVSFHSTWIDFATSVCMMQDLDFFHLILKLYCWLRVQLYRPVIQKRAVGSVVLKTTERAKQN